MSEQQFTIEQMRQALSRFCNGQYRMCVPAQKDDDDMILSYAIDQLEQAQAENEQLKADKQKLVEALETIRDLSIDDMQGDANYVISSKVLSEVKGMDRYILVIHEEGKEPKFAHELHGDDSYTDDIGCALEFETEREAIFERIDDERVAKLLYDEDGAITGYEIIGEDGKDG